MPNTAARARQLLLHIIMYVPARNEQKFYKLLLLLLVKTGYLALLSIIIVIIIRQFALLFTVNTSDANLTSTS